jgi:type VI secretion system protein ImpM
VPGEHLTTGFFGKVPATGDFVSRNLSGDFVRNWDRWVARHLAPPLSVDPIEDHPALRFLLGPDALGPMAGVVMASADRSGRCFPLTLAAEVPGPSLELAETGAGWFEALEEAGDAARYGEIGIGELEQRLSALPAPASEPSADGIRGMAFWVGSHAPQPVDPEAPGEALALLLVPAGEVL